MADTENNPSSIECVPDSMRIIGEAARSDPGYAWSWHCSIAMAFYHSWTNENRPADIHRKVNEGAARFLYNLFKIDVKEFPQYKALEKEWEGIPETVAMTPVATYDGVEFTRYTLAWLNGSMPEGTVLYAPTAEVEAKRLTTAQMLAGIPTADEFQALSQEHKVEEQQIPAEEVYQEPSPGLTD